MIGNASFEHSFEFFSGDRKKLSVINELEAFLTNSVLQWKLEALKDGFVCL